jgi:hypothetical protein
LCWHGRRVEEPHNVDFLYTVSNQDLPCFDVIRVDAFRNAFIPNSLLICCEKLLRLAQCLLLLNRKLRILTQTGERLNK